MNSLIFKHFYFIDSLIFTKLEEPFNVYIDILSNYFDNINNINFVYLVSSNKINGYKTIFSDEEIDKNIICIYV